MIKFIGRKNSFTESLSPEPEFISMPYLHKTMIDIVGPRKYIYNVLTNLHNNIKYLINSPLK